MIFVKYNSYVRELPYYGSTIFSAKEAVSKKLVALAVNVYGLHIISPETKVCNIQAGEVGATFSFLCATGS